MLTEPLCFMEFIVSIISFKQIIVELIFNVIFISNINQFNIALYLYKKSIQKAKTNAIIIS